MPEQVVLRRFYIRAVSAILALTWTVSTFGALWATVRSLPNRSDQFLIKGTTECEGRSEWSLGRYKLSVFPFEPANAVIKRIECGTELEAVVQLAPLAQDRLVRPISLSRQGEELLSQKDGESGAILAGMFWLLLGLVWGAGFILAVWLSHRRRTTLLELVSSPFLRPS